MSVQLLLDFTPLENSLKQLKKSLAYYRSDLAKKDKELAIQFMAASIQAFEFTYETCTKFLKRYLKMTAASAQVVEELSFPDLIRLGCEKGLLHDEWSKWRKYRDMRNITSHTYDERKALEVMKVIPDFIIEAEFVLNQLKQRALENRGK